MHCAVLPAASRTVHTTGVVPYGSVAGALLVVDTTPQLSLLVGEPSANGDEAKQTPPLVLMEIVAFGGHVTVGFCVSVAPTSVTDCTQLAVLPFASVAVHVTDVTPIEKDDGRRRL